LVGRLRGTWTQSKKLSKTSKRISKEYEMPKNPNTEIAVDKDKFDGLLRKMLATPPLPKSEIKVANPKPKKKKKSAA